MKPEISIIIPVFNGEKNISKSLDSLLEQTYTNFEVIIIDDGSEDNTSQVVKKYLNFDSRFKYIFQHNKGVSMARNRGLEASTGKYISFLDSDDYYKKSFIKEMYSTIVKTDSDVCYCGYNILTQERAQKKKTQFKKGNMLLEYILGTISVHTSCWMIKHSLLKKENIKFPKDVSWGEDFEFFFKVLTCTNKVTFVKKYLTIYRNNYSDEQLSSFSLDKIDKDYESIKRVLNRNNINSKVIRALIDYRLSALITYRLIKAIQIGLKDKEINNYFNKYSQYILRFTWNNGLRSLKLNISKLKLIFILKIYKIW